MEWALLLFGVGIWIAMTSLRTRLISPFCKVTPERCSLDQLNGLDRLYVGTYHSFIDALSFATQYCAGLIAFFAMMVMAKNAKKWADFRVDLMIFLQTLIWNGLLTELIHLLTQRPRPFVYLDPAQYGGLVAHYTSMVSGHTSYAAASSAMLIFTLQGRLASARAMKFAYASGAFWILSTAVFRVMAGRHFITDTIGGLFAGVIAAGMVALAHRSN